MRSSASLPLMDDVHPRHFSGRADPKEFFEWVSHMGCYFSQRHYDRYRQFQLAIECFSDYAEAWLYNLKDALRRQHLQPVETWGTLVFYMVQQYAPEVDARSYAMKVRSLSKRPRVVKPMCSPTPPPAPTPDLETGTFQSQGKESDVTPPSPAEGQKPRATEEQQPRATERQQPRATEEQPSRATELMPSRASEMLPVKLAPRATEKPLLTRPTTRATEKTQWKIATRAKERTQVQRVARATRRPPWNRAPRATRKPQHKHSTRAKEKLQGKHRARATGEPPWKQGPRATRKPQLKRSTRAKGKRQLKHASRAKKKPCLARADESQAACSHLARAFSGNSKGPISLID